MAENTPRAPPPQAPRSKRTAIIGALSTALVLLGGYLGLLNEGQKTWNSLFGHHHAPPKKVLAETTRIVVQDLRTSRLTFGQYLDNLSEPKSGFSRARLHEQGLFMVARVRLVGYRGRTMPVEWHIFDAASNDQVRLLRSTARADSSDDTATDPRWYHPRHTGHRYYLEYVVYTDHAGAPQEIARKRSKTSARI